ncbi:MAG: carbon monoxide dehydrogenase subunit G [Verrucomicrobiales bacterium]
MSKETLERELIIEAAPGQVWANLVDVPRVAGWLPFLHTIVEHDRLETYSAVLEDKVGPFAMRADLDISVIELDVERSIVVKAAGEDRAVRSRITIDAELRIAPREDGFSDVHVGGTYEVTGKVATLGAGLIRSKARKMVDEFCIAAQQGLCA